MQWLNAAKRTASYQRVLQIRGELVELGTQLDAIRQHLKTLHDDPRNAKVLLSYSKDLESFRARHNALNKVLARYTFHPALAYKLTTGTWRYGMVPGESRPGFRTTVSDGELTVNVREADVVAALVRLAAGRELRKVRLCEQCQKRWRVSLREMDRFCSGECREAWYVNSPDYKPRKAANQANYRAQLKRNGLL